MRWVLIEALEDKIIEIGVILSKISFNEKNVCRRIFSAGDVVLFAPQA